MNSIIENINDSLSCLDGPKYKLDELEEYYEKLQDNKEFNVNLVGINSIKNWGYDKDFNFAHDSKKFFSIKRVKYNKIENGIIHQPDIGVLGVLATQIGGILHILVQFKEEPGNTNKAQLSPTIQATKSNYSKAHGGSLPPYWETFSSIPKDNFIVNSLQPEQGLRYWQKFNQNVIVETDFIEEIPGFKWMTLGQVLAFSKFDNSINSCLRSVLSLIPFNKEHENKKLSLELDDLLSKSKKQYRNYGTLHNNIEKFYSKESDSFKFFSEDDLFSIQGVEVNIKNREVPSWSQPVIMESKNLYYVLLRFLNKNSISYLWKITPEPGYVNGFVMGPSEIIKTEESNLSKIKSQLIKKYECYGNISKVHTINMSEEGGRFWRVSVPHIIIDVNAENTNLNNKDSLLVSKSDTNKLLSSQFMGMEARSIFLLSKSLENFYNE
tara:strand:- start:902 stop:2215 length:1314 start_codon:yes stop_codon:yes gene_type:complete